MNQQQAVVVQVDSKEKQGEVVYFCSELKEAFQWTEDHQTDLKPGERFDIYYRCEEN